MESSFGMVGNPWKNGPDKICVSPVIITESTRMKSTNKRLFIFALCPGNRVTAPCRHRKIAPRQAGHSLRGTACTPQGRAHQQNGPRRKARSRLHSLRCEIAPRDTKHKCPDRNLHSERFLAVSVTQQNDHFQETCPRSANHGPLKKLPSSSS